VGDKSVTTTQKKKKPKLNTEKMHEIRTMAGGNGGNDRDAGGSQMQGGKCERKKHADLTRSGREKRGSH